MSFRITRCWRSFVCCALAFAVSGNASVLVQLQVVEGEGLTYRTGSRATRGITVLVTDENGQPVNMASVSFRLPDQGPSGAFNSGLRTEVVITGPDGRASIWGMQWNKTPGPVDIRITAVKDQARAGIISKVNLSDSFTPELGVPPQAGGQGVFTASHKGHKWLWIAAIAGAAAGGAGFALAHSSGSPGSSSTSAVTGLSIGTPSIIVGHP